MAQVGQTTQSGGREWTLQPQGGACRRVVVPVNCTINHLGSWLRESTTPNANDCRGFILTNAGLLVHSTAILENGVNSTSFALATLNFAGQSITAGTYIIGITAEQAAGAIVMCGQNDSTGLPTYLLSDPDDLFPDFPADASTYLRSDSGRQWDIYLDYTEAMAGGGAAVVLSQLQTHGSSYL